MILCIMLLLFGGAKLPSLMRNLGSSAGSLRRASRGSTRTWTKPPVASHLPKMTSLFPLNSFWR